jgi:acetoin:2,6-dichlorophenolindophenol oxidoreductase subunit alpha
VRSVDFGIIEGAVSKINHQVKLNIYKKMYRAKIFEERVIENVEKKNIKTAVYLSLGQESISAAIIEALGNTPYVFTQHRCHSIFLSLGGDILKVRDELLGLPTGCSNGKAGSNCLQIHENGINMFGHHGLIGENLPQAVGACFGSNHQTLCFIGDGAIEEDYVYPSIGFAVTHQLPIIIICEDNDLSILTKTKDRRSWDVFEMIKSLGVPSVNMSDDPWSIYLKILELSSQTTGPIFMNIKTCRKRWHVGVGTDNMEEWDRFTMVEEALVSLNLKEKINEIKREINHEMDIVWNQETLHQLLKK